MSGSAKTISWLWLLVGEVAVASPPRAVRVQVSEQACVIGQPVVVTFYAPTGPALHWHLIDAAFAKKPAVTVLVTETLAAAGTEFQHRVVFTATQGGRLQMGPFAVVGAGLVDTLYAPAITVQFRPESPRAALHPLRAIRPVWPAVGFPWQGAAGLLLLGAGAAGGLWWWKNQRAAPAVSAAQAQQLALGRIVVLEQEIQGSAHLAGRVPDQLFAILHAYFQHLPPLPNEATAAPAFTNARLADQPENVAPNNLLAELSQARFAPVSMSVGRAAGLLRAAKQLLLAPNHNAAPGKS
ncbi:MAG: hypothetical protein ACRYFZ_07695 [Janthinobacterium lividum]